MGPEEAKLMEHLFGDPTRRLRNLNVFAGERRCTREELCREINKGIEAKLNGTAIGSKHPTESGIVPIDVREWVKQFDNSV